MPSLRRLGLFAAAAALGVQAAYTVALRHGFRRATHLAPGPPAPPPPIAVVVAARNEARRLPALLDALARQTHAPAEVVVVDDASTDATAAVVAAHAARHPAVRCVRVGAAAHRGKKHALGRGIAATTVPLLAFTDADCVPPPTWLATLARRHAASPRPTVLVGYGPYRKRPDFLNRLVRYETLTTAWLTAGAVGLGRPYMAVGRNFSYPRAVFDRIGGFAHSLHSTSGDDDLFVQEVARRGAAEVVYVADAAAHVPSEAPPIWRVWLRQKRRHASAGRFYAPSVQRHLAVYHATSAALWLAPLVAGPAGALLLGVRLLLQRRALAEAADVLGDRDVLRRHPLLEGAYFLYNALVAPLGLVKMPRRW